MRIWLITDTHFGHENIKYLCDRPKDYEHLIIKNCSEFVSCNDLLIHLGDVALGSHEREWHRAFISDLPGKKWLIKGNHDTRSNSWYLDRGWDFVADSFIDKFYGKKVLFTHEPYINLGIKDYDVNIHGHLHIKTYSPKVVANYRLKLFSLEEMGYKPVLLETFLNN